MNNPVNMTIGFNKKYMKEVKNLAIEIVAGSLISRDVLINKIAKRITALIDDMFTQGIAASNMLVKQEIAQLVTDFNVPYKYNKAVIDKINKYSVFTGYYDTQYKGQYTKTEINRLKNIILKAKYGRWSEKDTIKEIQKTVKISNKKALLLARNENARLQTAAKTIYYKKIRTKYDLVWHNSGGNVRPEHRAMDGQKADADGNFHSSSCGTIPGPPFQCSPWNCKCYVTLEEK